MRPCLEPPPSSNEQRGEPATFRRARALEQIGDAEGKQSGEASLKIGVGDLLEEGNSDRLEALLVIGLSVHTTYSQAMHCEEEATGAVAGSSIFLSQSLGPGAAPSTG